MAADDIDNIFKSSSKAELLEAISKGLVTSDKAIVVLINDQENGKYSSQVMTLGLDTYYEAYGILEVAKLDLNDGDSKGG